MNSHYGQDPENREKRLRLKLGRELTAREKFYVALAEVCAPRSGKPLALSIEDNEAQLQLRKQILESDGFLVINAQTAEDALEMLREAPVSIVIADHMLSGAGGTQLVSDIKKVKPDVPVVLYSGRLPDSMQNVDCFINKAESVPQFLAIIRDLVSRYWA